MKYYLFKRTYDIGCFDRGSVIIPGCGSNVLLFRERIYCISNYRKDNSSLIIGIWRFIHSSIYLVYVAESYPIGSFQRQEINMPYNIVFGEIM